MALVWKKVNIEGGFESVISAAQLSVDEWVSMRNFACQDLLSDLLSNVNAKVDITLGAGFVDALVDNGEEAGDGTCKQGCSNPYRAFCQEGRCINPTCKNVKSHVHTSVRLPDR